MTPQEPTNEETANNISECGHAQCYIRALEALRAKDSLLLEKLRVAEEMWKADRHLIEAALSYHHAKDKEDSKIKKLNFIKACANYEVTARKVGIVK